METVENPEVIFSAGGSLPIIEKMKNEASAFEADITTPSGRKSVASFAYKIAQEKTRLDDMGKEYAADLKGKISVIDGERKAIRDSFDAMKETVRKSLTEFEQREKSRVEMIQSQLTDLGKAVIFLATPSAEEIAARIRSVEMFNFNEWAEFGSAAEKTKADSIELLNRMLAEAEKREAEQRELERLRAEQAERLRKEHEALIAKEAAEKARIEAEAKAKRDAELAAQAAEEIRLAAVREKEAAEAKAMQAQEVARAAEQRAIDAVELERKKLAEQKAAEDRDTALREADKKHRGKINNAAVFALTTAGLSEEDAKRAVVAIANGSIPNVKIAY